MKDSTRSRRQSLEDNPWSRKHPTESSSCPLDIHCTPGPAPAGSPILGWPRSVGFFGHITWYAGFSSLTRDRTHAPCSGSMESEPLDRQGSPKVSVITAPLSRQGQRAVYPRPCTQLSAPDPELLPTTLYHLYCTNFEPQPDGRKRGQRNWGFGKRCLLSDTGRALSLNAARLLRPPRAG